MSFKEWLNGPGCDELNEKISELQSQLEAQKQNLEKVGSRLMAVEKDLQPKGQALQWNPNTGKEEPLYKGYGSRSIEEAVEDLAVTCLIHNMDGPKKIVFTKRTMDYIEDQVKSKSWEFKRKLPSDMIVSNTSAGRIDLIEDVPDKKDSEIADLKQELKKSLDSDAYHITVLEQYAKQIRQLKGELRTTRGLNPERPSGNLKMKCYKDEQSTFTIPDEAKTYKARSSSSYRYPFKGEYNIRIVWVGKDANVELLSNNQGISMFPLKFFEENFWAVS